MAETENEPGPGRQSRRGALIGTYLVAAALGLALGEHLASGREPSTPLARVGSALQNDAIASDPKQGAALREAVDAVRAGWKMEDRDALDLVVALRGLATDGNSDWVSAERICQRLRWPRCDRKALEEMKQRSRP